jgi:hypothetical protein
MIVTADGDHERVLEKYQDECLSEFVRAIAEEENKEKSITITTT